MLKKYKKKGFSLIEVMVAISILSFTFISLMYAFPFGLNLNNLAKSATTASYLAQDKMEELHSLGYDNINVGTIETKQRLSVDPNNYLYNFQRETVVNYINGNLNEEAADQGLKKISVTIYYIDATSKSEKAYNITSIINER